jgi:hypothetical protein
MGTAHQRARADDHDADHHHDNYHDEPDGIDEPVEHDVAGLIDHITHDDHTNGTRSAVAIAEPVELSGAQTRHRYTGVP